MYPLGDFILWRFIPPDTLIFHPEDRFIKPLIVLKRIEYHGRWLGLYFDSVKLTDLGLRTLTGLIKYECLRFTHFLVTILFPLDRRVEVETCRTELVTVGAALLAEELFSESSGCLCEK